MNPRFVLAAALILAPSGVRGEERPSAEPLDLILIGGNRLIYVRIWAEVDETPVSAIWDQTIDRVFAFHDRDRNDVLDATECQRLPSPFGLRQVLWGQFQPLPNAASDAEANTAAGRVERDALAARYQRAGMGNVLVAVGKPPSTALLTDSLLKHLDKDADHRVGEAEWRKAAEALRGLDRNDDELIGPGELTPKVSYPGAAGTALVAAPSPEDPPAADPEFCPLVVLPARGGSPHWASVITQRLDRNGDERLDPAESGLEAPVFGDLDTDKDGRLASTELSALRTREPDAAWRVRLGRRGDGEPPLVSLPARGASTGPIVAAGRSRWELRADEGKLPESVVAIKKAYLAWFATADGNGDGTLEPSEKGSAGQDRVNLSALIGVADRDRDGRLSREEFTTWLELQEQVARGHVLLTVLDHGPGLFELLDGDHDGALSVRELRAAWDRVCAAGCVEGGAFDRHKLPRQLIATVSHGHPLIGLGRTPRSGPAWFRAMDRNADGDLSEREFVGAEPEFRRLDRDGDGLISVAEADRQPPSQ